MTAIPPENYAIELAVVVERIDGLKTSVDKLEASVTKQQESYVTKDELAARDREIKEIKDRHKEDIKEIKNDMKARVSVWMSGASLAAVIVGGVIALIQAVN